MLGMVSSGLLHEIRYFEEVILSMRRWGVFVKVEQTKTYESFPEIMCCIRQVGVSGLFSRGEGEAQRFRYLLEEKLAKCNASSPETAVTADEADFTFPERSWLPYLSGGATSKIRKTIDHRYYLRGSNGTVSGSRNWMRKPLTVYMRH